MMKLKKYMLLAPMLLGSSLGVFAGEGVKVEHLGVNNTLVRVEGDAPYLMMPVEEAIALPSANDGICEVAFDIESKNNAKISNLEIYSINAN